MENAHARYVHMHKELTDKAFPEACIAGYHGVVRDSAQKQVLYKV